MMPAMGPTFPRAVPRLRLAGAKRWTRWTACARGTALASGVCLSLHPLRPAGRCFLRSRVARCAARKTAVLMDGDGQGVREFRAAWKALAERLELVYLGVFAAEERLRRPDWQQFLRESGAEPVAVPPGPRRPTGTRSAPFGTAMGSAAVRWSKSTYVALMPSERAGRPESPHDANMDVDFVELVQWLLGTDAEVLAVLLEGPAFRCPESVGLSKQFARLGAEVFWVEVKWFGFRSPLMRAVLEPPQPASAGVGGFVESIPEEEQRGPLPDITALVARLLELGFMTTPRDAIAPAIARFWFQNPTHPPSALTVWPAQYPLHQLKDRLRCDAETVAERPSPSPSRGEMAFVMPVGSKGKATKEVIAKYGTADCRSISLGGGPFLLADSPQLCEEILRRLGYLDDELNSELDEAVALFCDGTANRRTLQVAGEAPLDAGARGDFCSCGRLGQAVAPRHDSIIMLGHDPLFTHMPWPALLDKMKLWLG
ncbi:unnamed protein product [Durusdinium trenchii]|uniref:Uncharacterized protein n=1 Tax=Durusdinium trenchii TaxID=1381693 RepID=A0ABP0IU50_9DINO